MLHKNPIEIGMFLENIEHLMWSVGSQSAVVRLARAITKFNTREKYAVHSCVRQYFTNATKTFSVPIYTECVRCVAKPSVIDLLRLFATPKTDGDEPFKRQRIKSNKLAKQEMSKKNRRRTKWKQSYVTGQSEKTHVRTVIWMLVSNLCWKYLTTFLCGSNWKSCRKFVRFCYILPRNKTTKKVN